VVEHPQPVATGIGSLEDKSLAEPQSEPCWEWLCRVRSRDLSRPRRRWNAGWTRNR